jgi:hypothetical protein
MHQLVAALALLLVYQPAITQWSKRQFQLATESRRKQLELYLVNHNNDGESFLDCMTNRPLGVYLIINAGT